MALNTNGGMSERRCEKLSSATHPHCDAVASSQPHEDTLEPYRAVSGHTSRFACLIAQRQYVLYVDLRFE